MKKMTKHHIIPRSRGGTNDKKNIMLVDEKKHQAYHTLFGNATPEEAVLILIREWWYKDKEKRWNELRELYEAIYSLLLL